VIDGLMKDHPGDKDVLFGAGQALLENGEPERALAAFTEVLPKAPDRFYVLQYRAEALDRLGREEEALRDLDESVRLKPEDGMALKNRGAALAKLGRTEEALEDTAEAWRINPLNPAFVDARASVLRKAGRGAETPALFDALIARDRSGMALNGRCWTRALANVELAVAEADCAKALELAPKSGPVWDSYALVALRDGKLPEAIRRYDKALEFSPKESTSLYGRGYAKIKSGDKAGGDADIAAARAINAKAGQELIDAGLTVN